MMDDYYGRTLGWNPQRGQRDPYYYPIIPQYDDYGVLGPFTNRIPVATRKVPIFEYDSGKDTESDSDYRRLLAKRAEKAAEAKAKATAEYEKAKAKVDEAKKALEECEAKMHAASKELVKWTKRFKKPRYAIMCY
ncbi:hypothetical protein E8E12_011698 [Didymella heteroderae]|uniref:Uncharacterized protein n=1 Tax=Didymella heteroderae TaxID=1769908 RepID=A0A9P4X202_9PLEO|nr:hypothetical protein E8E12_011698 [Didymella heteroderae]